MSSHWYICNHGIPRRTWADWPIDSSQSLCKDGSGSTLLFSIFSWRTEMNRSSFHFDIYPRLLFFFHLKNTKTHLEDKLLCYIFNNMHVGHVFNVHMHDYCIHYRWNYEWQSTIILCFLKVMCFLKVEWLHKLLQIENQTYY